MEKVENIQINPMYEQLVKEILEKHETEVIAMIEDLTKNLGQGNTADVRFLGLNNKVCLKIYKMPDQINDSIYYLTPSKEREFLEKLKGLGTTVRVPEVYASFEVADTVNPEHRHQFLMMETMPAVSVDDVLQGRATLPKDFNWLAFQNDLLDFVAKMHERRIYHRDLHEGNIMIDRETLKPYVIDFGASVEYWGSIEPGEPGPYHITKQGIERRLTSDESMIKLVVKKLRAKLTEMK